MSYQAVFQRYEIKYMISRKQKDILLQAMEPYMELDQYGHTTIRNIYYDTDNYRLIRRSIEKPAYKEKLRIRCYDQAAPDSTVFVELKKKYQDVVYKRRLSLTETEAMDWLSGSKHCGKNTQISAEIDYFLEYYKTLHPVVFLSYEREAFYAKDGSDFRVTFDENLLCRRNNLSLEADVWGIPLLEDDYILMELKCSGAIPIWMVRILSQEHIYKTSFSKYGTAYQNIILPSQNRLYQGDLPYEHYFSRIV